jgi:sugar phosphate isomerase/epimerase
MNQPPRNPLEEIDWFGRQGFDVVDFTLEPPAAGADQIDPGAVRAALDRHGLGVVAHTAWFIPLGSPFASVRDASLVEFRGALRAARQMGATVMNVHYAKPPGFFSKEQVIGWHVEVLSRLCQEAAGMGITIVLEHVPHGGGEQLENIVAVMERVPLLRFHLDGGHAKLERGYDRWQEYLDESATSCCTSTCRRTTARRTSSCPWQPPLEARLTGPTTSRSSRRPATTARSPWRSSRPRRSICC